MVARHRRVDKIGPELLKVLDIVGLTHLFNTTWELRTMPMDWLLGWELWEVCLNYRGITLRNLLEKAYDSVLERTI